MYFLSSISQLDSSSERIEISSAHASVLRVILFVILNFPKSPLVQQSRKCRRSMQLCCCTERDGGYYNTIHHEFCPHARAVSIVTAHKRVSDVNDRYYQAAQSNRQHIVS